MPDQRYAVIVAPNNSNLGMYSVDLAAQEVFRASGRRFDIFRYVGTRWKHSWRYGGIDYLEYRSGKQLEGYDRVVLWGDFTTMPYYGWNDFAVLVSRHEYNPITRLFRKRDLLTPAYRERHFRRWKELFVDAPASRPVSQSVGQNFQIIGGGRGAEGENRAETRESLAHFSDIIVRDSTSYANLAALDFRSPAPRIVQGMDAAFLLQPRTGAREAGTTGRPRVGLFFKRSRLKHVERLEEALRTAGFEVGRVPWLHRSIGGVSASFGRAMDSIASFDAVISDTYHCLVNSHREGAAIVGLGRPVALQTTTLSDYKKKVLFEDIGIGERYFELPDGELSEPKIAAVVACLESVLAIGRERDFERHRAIVAAFRAQVETRLFGGSQGAGRAAFE